MHIEKSTVTSIFIRLLMIAVVFYGFTVFSSAEESTVVRIPVTCTGEDCHVMLYDLEGGELEQLLLREGENAFFEVKCTDLKDHQYRVKLMDKDTEGRTYDRKEYCVTVSACRGEGNRIYYVITADQAGTRHTRDSGKVEELNFVNSVSPSVPGGKDPGSKNVDRKARDLSNEKSAKTNSTKPGDSSGTGRVPGKLPDVHRIQGKLPQTGSLWLWLAPWVAIAGTGMMTVGLRLRRKAHCEKNNKK